MTTFEKEMSAQEALEHYGVKGMKWGVRKDDSGPSRGQARKEIMEVGKTARGLIRESRRASSQAERNKVAKKYEAEVLEKVKSPEFKAAYDKASTMSKGEMAVHAVAFGPLAAVSIPMMRAAYKNQRENGVDLEIDTAHEILREMRRP